MIKPTTIAEYNAATTAACLAICCRLQAEIDAALPDTESKVWHGHPVWFIDGNPVAGYSQRKSGVVLLFWSGQSFDEVGLRPSGKFKAAEVIFADDAAIISADLHRWLQKARDIQWDYKNIVKRRGVLERLT